MTEVRQVTALADVVRSRRKALGLTQEELALLAGSSARFVHTVEQGKRSLRLDKLLDLLEVLGLGLAVVPGPGDVSVGSPEATDPGDAPG